MKDNIISFEQYEQSEEALQSLQKEYLKKAMSEEQLSRLKMKMEEAKCENRKERRNARITRITATAAALALMALMIFIISSQTTVSVKISPTSPLSVKGVSCMTAKFFIMPFWTM